VLVYSSFRSLHLVPLHSLSYGIAKQYLWISVGDLKIVGLIPHDIPISQYNSILHRIIFIDFDRKFNNFDNLFAKLGKFQSLIEKC